MENCSIIIPIYKRIDVLSLTLHALSLQNNKDFKVILVDQGNSIGIEKIHEIVGDRLEYEYVNLPIDVTVAEKRNKAIELTSSKHLIFIDSDIVVSKDFVNEHISTLEHGGDSVVGYIYGKSTIDDKPYPPLPDLFESDRFSELIYEIGNGGHFYDEREEAFQSCNYNIMNLKAPWSLYWSGNISIRKEVLEETGGFDTGFCGWGGEDIELGYRLIKGGFNISLNKKAYGIHLHDHSRVTDRKNQYARNLRYFVGKYPRLEIELYSVFPVHWHLFVDYYKNITPSNYASFEYEIRNTIKSLFHSNINILGYDELLVKLLIQITSIMDPRRLDYCETNIKKYELSGLCTFFAENFFDATIITPLWVEYHHNHIHLLFEEMLRISKYIHIIVPWWVDQNKKITLLSALGKLGNKSVSNFKVDSYDKCKIVTVKK